MGTDPPGLVPGSWVGPDWIGNRSPLVFRALFKTLVMHCQCEFYALYLDGVKHYIFGVEVSN